jgi:hypothetical protein
MESSASTAIAMPRVDTHLLKFSQAWIAVPSALAFILNLPILVLITGVALAISALFPAVGPFRLLYRYVAVPVRLLHPRVVEDDPAPHRFAQGVGATFLLAASAVLFLTSATTLGWALDLIVFVLSGLNFSVGFCAGCFVYFQLGRLGLLPRVPYSGGFRWRGA